MGITVGDIMNLRSTLALLVAIGVFATAPSSYAASNWVGTFVQKTLITDDSEFGGCMFQPSVSLSGSLDCPNTWISVDCAGTLGGTKSAGSRRFDAVQLAMVTSSKLYVKVDDGRKINGWCVAERIQGFRLSN